MHTGDKVATLLVVKALCCPLLALAAGGALGRFGVWLIHGAGKWVLGLALILLILWLFIDRRPAEQRSGPGEPAAEQAPPLGEVVYLHHEPVSAETADRADFPSDPSAGHVTRCARRA